MFPVFSEPAPGLAKAKSRGRKSSHNSDVKKVKVAAREPYSLRTLSPQAADIPNAPSANVGRANLPDGSGSPVKWHNRPECDAGGQRQYGCDGDEEGGGVGKARPLSDGQSKNGEAGERSEDKNCPAADEIPAKRGDQDEQGQGHAPIIRSG